MIAITIVANRLRPFKQLKLLILENIDRATISFQTSELTNYSEIDTAIHICSATTLYKLKQLFKRTRKGNHVHPKLRPQKESKINKCIYYSRARDRTVFSKHNEILNSCF